MNRPQYESGAGSLLEVVDLMCSVTETLADIVRKQAILIEQEKMAAAVDAGLAAQRKQADNDLDIIEMKLRRI